MMLTRKKIAVYKRVAFIRKKAPCSINIIFMLKKLCQTMVF